jgi:hypothetical protein
MTRRTLFDIRIALENQAAVARGIESAVAGLSCNGESSKNGCQMLLMQHAEALQGLVDELCKVGAAVP